MELHDKLDTIQVKLEYNEEKETQTTQEFKIFYNYIYNADLGEPVGSEQAGERPVLVVDNYITSTVCVIIPLTLERLNDNKDFHVDLNNGMGTALIEQIRAISKERISSPCFVGNQYATVDDDDWKRINVQLHKICQLNPIYKKKR